MTRLIAAARRLITRFLPEGAAILSVLYLANYAFALVRARTLAQSFGAGGELDAYVAAFRLPELLFDVLVEAGLAAAFIPIFLRLRSRTGDEDTQEANRFARTVLTLAVGIMGIGSVLLFVFAEATTAVIAPGFEGEQRELYVALFRLMLASQVVFAASLTLGQVLLAEQRFFWYGIAPMLYNAGIVAGTLLLTEPLGIYGAGIGALAGSLLHLASRFIGLRGSSLRIGLDWRVRTEQFGEFVRLTIPKLVTQPVEPVTFAFFTAVASGFAAGTVAAIDYAGDLHNVPISLVGVAFALAVFPALSRAHAAGDRAAFLWLVKRNLLSVVVLTVGAAVVIAVFSRLIVRTLLGGGAFDADDVALTSTALAAFAIAIPLESISHLLSRAIYATRHTLLQVLASLIGLLLTVVGTLALVDGIGLLAIPFGLAIGQGVKMLLLVLALAVRLRTLPGAAAGDAG